MAEIQVKGRSCLLSMLADLQYSLNSHRSTSGCKLACARVLRRGGLLLLERRCLNGHIKARECGGGGAKEGERVLVVSVYGFQGTEIRAASCMLL